MPKTVDNDLPVTDTCPGFGSVAKYVAVSTNEAALDVASMARTSTRVFILEVMGRHAGWIAAAAGLAGEKDGEAPHVILFPEIPFEEEPRSSRASRTASRYEYCVVVVSEGAHYADGRFLAEAGGKDAFGHAQLGGVAATDRAARESRSSGFKYHYAIADYLQRAARHIASKVDVDAGLRRSARPPWSSRSRGENAVMPTIVRKSDKPYRWTVGKVDARGGREQREDDAAQFHRQGRFRDHGRVSTLLGAAHRRRGSYPPYQQRPADLRQPTQSAGYATARQRLCAKVVRRFAGGREKQKN